MRSTIIVAALADRISFVVIVGVVAAEESPREYRRAGHLVASVD
jgi:hypothetical protein